MDHEIWQRLLSLESRDIVDKWFKNIHDRKLNARRAKEINFAARQAREFFRNADASNYSVRPLLTFYGVASLSRALSLLLRRDGGEECLTAGHGLETIDWRSKLSGNLSSKLSGLGEIKIRTCNGLFADLATSTRNRISIHVQSSAVDWRLNYDIPNIGDEITLVEVMSRIPDLKQDFESLGGLSKYSAIGEMNYNVRDGFKAKVAAQYLDKIKEPYLSVGYIIENGEKYSVMKADSNVFSQHIPQFVHTYVEKTFGSIHQLYIAEPFRSGNRYSQLCITYMLSYILGMLVRYYPTHWISLIQGEKGDAIWPSVNRAQRYVEQSFPELVIELIFDILVHPE